MPTAAERSGPPDPCNRSDTPWGARRVAPRAAEQPARSVAAAAAEYKGDLLNKTYYPTSADASNVTKKWFVIDAEGQTLGRLATLAAMHIR